MKRIIAVACLFGLYLVLSLPLKAMAIGSIGAIDNTSWNGLSDAAGYNNIEVDITPEIWNGGGDAYYYSLSPYFSNNTNVYGGLQTNTNDGQGHAFGKGAIFSVWNVSSGIAEPGGYGTPFGGEGNGYSVRIPYNWSTGVSYRFKIYLDQDASSGNRLWGASVTNLSNGQVTRVGRIYTPVDFGKIHSPVTFHERYSGGTQSCAEISPSQVSFTNMTANDGGVRASLGSHYVTKSVPECGEIMWLQDHDGGYRSAAGVQKPAPAPAPSPKATATSKPPTKAPPPAPTPPKPTETITKPTSNVVVAKINPPTPKSAKKSTSPFKIAVLGVGGLLLVGGMFLLARRFTLFRRWQKLLAKHFPHDIDIHGPSQ